MTPVDEATHAREEKDDSQRKLRPLIASRTSGDLPTALVAGGTMEGKVTSCDEKVRRETCHHALMGRETTATRRKRVVAQWLAAVEVLSPGIQTMRMMGSACSWSSQLL